MVATQEPSALFSEWRPWRARERVADTIDVPKRFGVLGIYLLAVHKKMYVDGHSNPKNRHLNPHVIYIGMSRHITQRLERYHAAVQRYRSESGDLYAKRLSFASWESAWSGYSHADETLQGPLAYVGYLERKLIWEYVKSFNRLPIYNHA